MQGHQSNFQIMTRSFPLSFLSIMQIAVLHAQLQLFVQEEFGDRPARAVEVSKDATVNDLCQEVAKLIGNLPGALSLSFQGRALNNGSVSLADSGVSSESIVHVQIKKMSEDLSGIARVRMLKDWRWLTDDDIQVLLKPLRELPNRQEAFVSIKITAEITIQGGVGHIIIFKDLGPNDEIRYRGFPVNFYGGRGYRIFNRGVPLSQPEQTWQLSGTSYLVRTVVKESAPQTGNCCSPM